MPMAQYPNPQPQRTGAIMNKNHWPDRLARLIICIAITLQCVCSAANEFVFKRDLEPLLKRDPDMGSFLLEYFDFSETGESNYLSAKINPAFKGQPIGLYVILAGTKCADRICTFSVTVRTNSEFTDSDGNRTPIHKATTVREKVSSVYIKTVGATQVSESTD